MHILLIDDDEIFREVLRESLIAQLSDIRITEADDGDTGLLEFKKNQFDAILVDMNMPRMSGLSLASIIRETDKIVPIILLSGLTVGLNHFTKEIFSAGVSSIFDKSDLAFNSKLVKEILNPSKANQATPDQSSQS